MNKPPTEKYELKLSELEFVLDDIIFSIDWLLKEMEGLRKNKKKLKLCNLIFYTLMTRLWIFKKAGIK